MRLYRLHGDWPESETDLDAELDAGAFRPCGPAAERSAGWEPPTNRITALGSTDDEAPLCRRLNGADLLRLRSQTRILPAAAVREALEERVDSFQRRAQRDPSSKEKRDLKEEVRAELLPRALLKSERTAGALLLDERVLAVDTASDKEAELFLDNLRKALGALEAVPLAFKKPVSGFLKDLFLGNGPRTFVLGRECRMEDPAVKGAYVQWSDVELNDTSVRRHVRDGFQVDRLAVEYDALVGVVIDQQGALRKLKLTGLDTRDVADADEDPLARLDAEFVLLTGSLRRLLGAMKKQLGGFA